MNNFKIALLIMLVFFLWDLPANLFGCTTAVISKFATDKEVPMLWKNRDTGTLSNKVIFVNEKPYCFIGIVNAKETSGRFVYAGLNSAGFGIINTVAYNLPKKENEVHDLEGQIMSDALRKCRTIDDFELYLKSNLGESLGSWSTFGVIDPEGGSALFEVHNNGYKKLDPSEEKTKYLIVTNFARSGEEGEGEGYLRYERASVLFGKMSRYGISPDQIFRNISRDLGNILVKHPSIGEIEKSSLTEPLWIHSRNCINRPSTSAAIIIKGKNKHVEGSKATFWVILGEPVTSIAIPLWVESGSVPDELCSGSSAPICTESMRIKKMIHPFSEGSKKNYLNTSVLLNREGSGFLPVILETEKEIFNETNLFLLKDPGPEEMRIFQAKIALKVLKVLSNIR